ncbi:PDZ and LIM domain protein 3-like isoform X2 [Gigantopelta aegis]|uniref:PDZ and LIM domain protein 3-like isoform X2 n=1 Tax=Gigantopelta aegis TaxID=1735272 RepID=UPI001B88A8E5|nr:PDZ and LIM domain protein 3-like isoform X2 [Gigantopelta aegis]
MSNIECQAAETLQVQLSRPDTGTPWGFRLQGGVDFSTPLSIQVVQPNSVSERAGLVAGDAILQINNTPADTLTHENAKMEIVRSGNDINLLIARGAVRIWKPQVTPLSELRPAELRTIKTATGDEMQTVQRTSLVMNKPSQEPCAIGSSHNRAAQPFGAPKTAIPNVVHAQYNTPIGLYSPDNIANTYTSQTAGIQKEMQNLDINDQQIGAKMTGTYQPVASSPGQSARYQDLNPGEEIEYKGYTNPNLQSRSFHAVAAKLEEEGECAGFRPVQPPAAKPPGQQKPQQPSMRCGGCDMLATGVIVRAKGTPYHVECFKCASCGMNLKQKGYFVIEDKLFCEIHAKRMAQAPDSNMVATAVYR